MGDEKKALRCLRHATNSAMWLISTREQNIQKNSFHRLHVTCKTNYNGATLSTLPARLLHLSHFKILYTKDGTCPPLEPLITLDFYVPLPGSYSALFCCT